MKKIFYLFSITFLILQSCSSGDSESTNTDTILIKKTIETDPQGIYTNIFEYNGNKIVKVNSLINNNLIGTALYTYSGNLITEVNVFGNTNNLVQKNIYNYNSDSKVTSFVELDYLNNIGRRATYNYNSNGTISSAEYEGSLTSQSTLKETKTITFTNGEVSSLIEQIGSITKTTYYTYDNKNSPFKNVLNHDKLAYCVFRTFTSEINNNLTKINKVQSGINNMVSNFQYNYNSSDYPTLKSSVEYPNQSTQFFY
jgi:hypothetical protein